MCYCHLQGPIHLPKELPANAIVMKARIPNLFDKSQLKLTVSSLRPPVVCFPQHLCSRLFECVCLHVIVFYFQGQLHLPMTLPAKAIVVQTRIPSLYDRSQLKLTVSTNSQKVIKKVSYFFGGKRCFFRGSFGEFVNFSQNKFSVVDFYQFSQLVLF